MEDPRRFDDQGFFSPNKKRTSDKAPSHTGKVNLSDATLDGLIAARDAGEEVAIQLAGWRKQDNPNMVKLKVSLPFKGNDGNSDRRPQGNRPQGGGGYGQGQRRQGQGQQGSRRQYQDNDFGNEDDLL